MMDTATKREVKALLRRGEDALVRRDYERASTYFRRAYTADPGNIAAITNLGYSYAKMGRFSHAQKCFITALDIDPDNQAARKNLSLLMKPDKDGSGQTPVAVQRRSSEDQFIRYMQWGNLQMEQRNFFAAIQYFKEASKIHPGFIEPFLKIGISFEELHEYGAAVAAFSDALDIFPKDPVAQDHLERCRGLADERDNGDRIYREGTGNKSGEKTIPSSIPARAHDTLIPGHHSSAGKPGDRTRDEALTESSPVREGERAPEPARSPPAAAPAHGDAPQSEDDVIKSILDQYSDLISSGKPKDGEDTPDHSSAGIRQGSPAPEVQVKPTPAPQGSDDDIVSNILMQYQEELDPNDSQPPQGEQPQDETPHTGDAPLGRDGNTMSEKKKDGIHVELNDDQKDALRELGNIGASHAATTLSTMLNTPIMLNVPEISIMDFDEISKQIPHENSAMVIFTMEGQMAKAGYVILHVPKESVVQMTSIMLGMPIEADRDMNEMDESAINEIGNIMVSAFLDGTAELLGIIMLPSPPRTLFDYPKKVFDLIIQESNILYDNVVFFRTELICDEHELNLNIFMLPNPPVLQEIVRMLEKIIEDSAIGT
jgi:chemotaxis protein CheC